MNRRHGNTRQCLTCLFLQFVLILLYRLFVSFDPSELLFHPGPQAPARSVTVLGEDDSPAGLGEREFPPRSVTTSCWGRHQGITQPSPQDLLAEKAAQGPALSLMVFPQGTGQQLPSDSLEESGTGWRWGLGARVVAGEMGAW